MSSEPGKLKTTIHRENPRSDIHVLRIPPRHYSEEPHGRIHTSTYTDPMMWAS